MPLSKLVAAHHVGVYDIIAPDGKDLGQVQDLVLDFASGRIAFVIIAFGGILGLTDKWFAVPWEILEWAPERRKFILNLDRKVLEQAPGIDKNKWPAKIDLAWLSACYAHYGCAPYWAEPLVTEDNVKKLAYTIWESENQPESRADEHYFRAERILREQEARRQPPEFMTSSPQRRP